MDVVRKPKILLVDDDVALRSLLAEEFLDRDYAVTEAEDGKAAIDQILLSPFDLILTDVKMPRLGGLELLAQVRRCFPQIPVILMTAFEGAIPLNQKDRKEAFACIFKPIVLEELHGLVVKALTQKEVKS